MTAAARALGVFGALSCSGAVALSAVASHGLDGHAAQQGGLAAAFAFGHGLALVVLAPTATTRRRTSALAMLAVGTALFAGTLVTAAFAGTPTALAPVGGGLLIAGWALLAVDVFRAPA